jgi:hypothetical protein
MIQVNDSGKSHQSLLMQFHAFSELKVFPISLGKQSGGEAYVYY